MSIRRIHEFSLGEFLKVQHITSLKEHFSKIIGLFDFIEPMA